MLSRMSPVISVTSRVVVFLLELTGHVERACHKTSKLSSNTESKVGKVERQQTFCFEKQKCPNSRNKEPPPLLLNHKRHILGSQCKQFGEPRDRLSNTPFLCSTCCFQTLQDAHLPKSSAQIDFLPSIALQFGFLLSSYLTPL